MDLPAETDPTSSPTTTHRASNDRQGHQEATVIYVAYGTKTLDLSWIPEGVPILIVHNDDLLPESACRPGCKHIYPRSNIGFGKGVNLALEAVDTGRVIICNPDATLTPVHWHALSAGEADQVVTVRLVDDNGDPKASAFPYPSPLLLVLGITRAIQAAPTGSLRRRILTRALGGWGRKRKWSIEQSSGRYPLDAWWASGAVLSFDTRLLKSVGGFDANYFLYFEDTDLCRRIARQSDSASLLIADGPPAQHHVGGSARTSEDRKMVARERWESARRYASTEEGWGWQAARLFLAVGTKVVRIRTRPVEPPG